jgi:hypothetical protein
MVLGWWNLWWNKNDASVTVILQSGYTIMIYYDLLWSIYSGCIWEKLDDRRFWSETKSEAWLGRRGWWSVTGGEVTVIIHSGDQRGVAQLWQLWQPIYSFFFCGHITPITQAADHSTPTWGHWGSSQWCGPAGRSFDWKSPIDMAPILDIQRKINVSWFVDIL